MKRIFFTTVSLGVLGLMSPALAADLPTYSKAPVVAAPVYDWTGFYVGVFGGGGYGDHTVVNAAGLAGFANYSYTYDGSGYVAGGDIGYNVQSGSYLVGVEATGFWSGIKGNDASQQLGVIDATSLREVGTLVARGGLTVDRLLLFFTGGWAYGNILHTSTNGAAVDQFAVSRNGLTAGGGIAYAVTNNVIAKFDYTVNSTYSVVTLGIDFKFGGPVVAKY